MATSACLYMLSRHARDLGTCCRDLLHQKLLSAFLYQRRTSLVCRPQFMLTPPLRRLWTVPLPRLGAMGGVPIRTSFQLLLEPQKLWAKSSLSSMGMRYTFSLETTGMCYCSSHHFLGPGNGIWWQVISSLQGSGFYPWSIPPSLRLCFLKVPSLLL